MIGFDILGLAHPRFRVDTVLKSLPDGVAIGVFDDPFGRVLPKLRKLLSSGKFPACRIHAHWSNQHKIIPMKKLKEKLPGYEKLQQDFPMVHVYVSHSCEYDESSKVEVLRRVNLIKEMAPSCTPVNSVLRGPTTDGALVERHGVPPHNGQLSSTDGVNVYDIDAATWMNNHHSKAIQFLWGARFNLREIPDPGEPVPPPSQRTAAPSVPYMKSVVRLAFPKGTPPNPTMMGPFITLKAPDIYKTHAEDDQGQSEPRENKPCLIVSANHQHVTIVTCNGDGIGKLINGGSFGRNQFRYYSGMPRQGGINKYGWEIGNLARAVSGSEWVWFKAGSKYYGPVHPAFRQGVFR